MRFSLPRLAAGFLMTAAGHVLRTGEVVEYDGLLFKVERVERRRIMRIKLEVMDNIHDTEPIATSAAPRN